jgi:hypothetical protein
VPSRPSPILASIDTPLALEDALDMLFAGARSRLALDQQAAEGVT